MKAFHFFIFDFHSRFHMTTPSIGGSIVLHEVVALLRKNENFCDFGVRR